MSRHKRNALGRDVKHLGLKHPNVILMWAIAFPTSTWNTFGGMVDDTFDFLIEKLKAGRINQLPPVIVQSLQSLGEEEPLNMCNTF